MDPPVSDHQLVHLSDRLQTVGTSKMGLIHLDSRAHASWPVQVIEMALIDSLLTGELKLRQSFGNPSWRVPPGVRFRACCSLSLPLPALPSHG